MTDAGPDTIAFTFPGQGSQTPGMGAPWTAHPSWELVAEASEATNRDVAHLLLDADADELRQTRNAQLATFVLSLVALDAAERSGTMRAVLGLGLDAVEVACARVDGDVWVANDNAPGQVVIAGAPEALDAAAAEARALGARKVLPMTVGGAFHTPFMASARDRLRTAIASADVRDPDVVVHANVDALPHPVGSTWPGLLAAALCRPVRWRPTLDALAAAGTATFVEVGPGKVLTGLARRTVDGARTISVSSPDDLDRLVEVLAAPLPGARS